MAGHLLMFVTDTIELNNFRFSQDLWNVQDPLRVENLPPHVDNNYITTFFDNQSSKWRKRDQCPIFPRGEFSLG